MNGENSPAVECRLDNKSLRLMSGEAAPTVHDSAMHCEAADEIERLRTALRQVAQAHAWLAFGECRSFGSDVTLLSPSDADAVARVALGEYREGHNV